MVFGERFTQKDSPYECKLKECEVDNWIRSFGGDYAETPCDTCPFMKIVNKLAEYEDEAEKLIDDGK